jgi:hypothetical protein
MVGEVARFSFTNELEDAVAADWARRAARRQLDFYFS